MLWAFRNSGTFSKHGCFWQDQVSRDICHGLNMLMDVLIGPNFKDLLAWVKYLNGLLEQDQMSASPYSMIQMLYLLVLYVIFTWTDVICMC